MSFPGMYKVLSRTFHQSHKSKSWFRLKKRIACHFVTREKRRRCWIVSGRSSSWRMHKFGPTKCQLSVVGLRKKHFLYESASQNAWQYNLYQVISHLVACSPRQDVYSMNSQPLFVTYILKKSDCWTSGMLHNFSRFNKRAMILSSLQLVTC